MYHDDLSQWNTIKYHSPLWFLSCGSPSPLFQSSPAPSPFPTVHQCIPFSQSSSAQPVRALFTCAHMLTWNCSHGSHLHPSGMLSPALATWPSQLCSNITSSHKILLSDTALVPEAPKFICRLCYFKKHGLRQMVCPLCAFFTHNGTQAQGDWRLNS